MNRIILIILFVILNNLESNAQFALALNIKGADLIKCIPDGPDKIHLLVRIYQAKLDINNKISIINRAFATPDFESIYYLQIDYNLNLLDSFRLICREIELRDMVLSPGRKLYFQAIHGIDTIHASNGNIFISPTYGNKRDKLRILSYDIEHKDLKLLKTITSKLFNFPNLDYSNNELWTWCSHNDSAFIDGQVFPPLVGTTHEMDILGLKIEELTGNINSSIHITGESEQIPLYFCNEFKDNAYISFVAFSNKLYYKGELKWMYERDGKYFGIFKFDSLANLHLVAKADNPLYSIRTKSLDRLLLIGTLYNQVNLNSFNYVENTNSNVDYLAEINPNGEVTSFWHLKGKGDRIFNQKSKLLSNNKLLLVGSFADQILEENNEIVTTKGDLDLFTYILDENNKILWKSYWHGNNLDKISDIERINNGDYLLLGSSLSDTLTFNGDTLVKVGNSKVYFIYKLKNPDNLTFNKEIKSSNFNCIVYPNPAKRNITIEWNDIIPEPYTIKIVDPFFKILKEYEINNPKTTLSLELFPTGIYYLLFNLHDGGIKAKKIFLSN